MSALIKNAVSSMSNGSNVTTINSQVQKNEDVMVSFDIGETNCRMEVRPQSLCKAWDTFDGEDVRVRLASDMYVFEETAGKGRSLKVSQRIPAGTLIPGTNTVTKLDQTKFIGFITHADASITLSADNAEELKEIVSDPELIIERYYEAAAFVDVF